MTLSEHRKLTGTILLLITLGLSIFSTNWAHALMQTSSNIPAIGMINYWPKVDVTVNIDKVIGTNNLSLGFQLDWSSWIGFTKSTVRQQLAREANFKIVRVFDFRPTNPRLMPCTYWDESTKTGTWNWTNVDTLTMKIFEIGAEPLFCLGWAAPDIQRFIPPGMAVDPITELPYPESYALYAAEWVKHFKRLGLPVRFYEIMNEPFAYFGWNAANMTKLGYYVEFWNYIARRMRQENPNILLSQDCITQRKVFDYWLLYGDDVDFLDFHKYDASAVNEASDSEMFRRAETYRFETTTSTYGVDYVRQKWFEKRGKLLPVINSESNFCSAWETGTDPRIQQMAGAVWTSLVLRMGILKGLSYNVYFEFLSSASYGKTTQTGGYGFGMINSDNNKPWYPYYVNYMIGKNLAVGDKIAETTSSSEDVRTLAWLHNQTLNILIICKVDQTRAVRFYGLEGYLNISKIDNTISWENPNMQNYIINSDELLILNGYTVALVQLAP